jgi:hypothetical protein
MGLRGTQRVKEQAYWKQLQFSFRLKQLFELNEVFDSFIISRFS